MPNVYTAEYLDKFEVCDYRWGDDKYPNARQLRDKKARELRGEGWTVKVGKYDYSDLGHFVLYWLEATRPKTGN